MRNITVICIGMFVSFSPIVFAIETEEVSLGEAGVYDGSVLIERDASGRMTLEDNEIGPLTLQQLAQPASDHGALTGLDADDHLQYLNAARHDGEHDTAYNNALPAGPDLAANATLGGHLADSRIHLHRLQPEEVSGDWRFTGQPDFQGDVMFSANGIAGDSALQFNTSGGTAHISWDDTAGRFRADRGLLAERAVAGFTGGATAPQFLHGVTLNPASGNAPVEQIAVRTRLDLNLGGTASHLAGSWAAANEISTYMTTTSIGEHSGRVIGLVAHSDADGIAADLVSIVATLPEDAPTTGAIALLAGIARGDLGSYAPAPGQWAGWFVGDTVVTGRLEAASYSVGDPGGTAQALWLSGTGSPEGAAAAPVGSLYSRLDGGAGTSLYVKESGSSNTGWAAK